MLRRILGASAVLLLLAGTALAQPPWARHQPRPRVHYNWSNPWYDSNLPPGLAKRNGNLPPGLQKHLDRTGHLPPGLEKRYYSGQRFYGPPGSTWRWDSRQGWYRDTWVGPRDRGRRR